KKWVAITIAIEPGTGDSGMVSGGAGYTTQSSSGPSGTSTFSLTAPQSSAMTTIAIAPDAESLDQILP
ncbi:MAG: hypothetical protein DRP65_08815, partial [Planctomycetota bacterium]